MNSRPLNNQHGFTLLELLIAISLLVVISFAIYQAVTTTFRLRDTIGTEGDFYNGIRLSMTVLDRDVTLLYSPTLMLPPKAKPTPSATNPNALPPPVSAQEQELLTNGDLAQQSAFWNAAVDTSGVRPSHFVGTDKKMSFISASHIRMYKDAPESDFAKITYELKSDTLEQAIDGTRVLVRTENTDAFSDDDGPFSKTKMSHTYPLLHGIKSMRFRYYDKVKDHWYDAWDNQSSDFKDMYPDMVEVVLEVVGPNRLSFQGTYDFRPEIPIDGIDPST